MTIAGGITTPEEVKALDELGCEAQIGMALYTGRLGLAEAYLRLGRAGPDAALGRGRLLERGGTWFFNGHVLRRFLPGLPISACFRPDGFDRVYSALSVEEKNRISHRARALEAALPRLRELADPR